MTSRQTQSKILEVIEQRLNGIPSVVRELATAYALLEGTLRSNADAGS